MTEVARATDATQAGYEAAVAEPALRMERGNARAVAWLRVPEDVAPVCPQHRTPSPPPAQPRK
jgi:hypothetical protein